MKTATNNSANNSANTSSDPDRTPVAKDVFTYCTKEKIDTWHVVMAHNAQGVVDRVQCKACRSEHKYKRQNPLVAPRKSTAAFVRGAGGALVSTSTRASAAAAKAAESAASLEESWLKGLKKWGARTVAAFDPALSYALGDVFEHASFGKGVVQTRRENKIDVLFRAGLKTLPSKQNPS